MQAFYAAINAKALDQACALLTDDVCFATLTGNCTGKTAVCHYLQALADADVTFVITVTRSVGNTVYYAYRILARGVLIDAGDDGLAHLHNDLILFDGTSNNIQQESC